MERFKFITLISTLMVVGTLSAKTIEVGALGASGHVDTEVATNVIFNASRGDARMFEVRLEFSGSESNSFQIAFGRDADRDGDLAPEETRLVLGWRAGRYFVEDVTGASRLFETNVGAGAQGRFLDLRVATDDDFVPKDVVFANEAGTCFAELSAAVPAWLYSADWNLLKLTRRGTVPADEWCRVVSRSRSFHVTFR